MAATRLPSYLETFSRDLAFGEIEGAGQ